MSSTFASPEHQALRATIARFVDEQINPHVDDWEKAQTFPAKELFRKMGRLGFLGVNKPVEFGGQGLDYSFAAAFAEGLSHIRCGGVPMAIGVQTDMATPALARFGSEELKRTFLAPAIAGDMVNNQLIDIYVVFGGLIGAIVWNIITWLLGLPTSSSHALIGGLGGAAVLKSGIAALRPEGWMLVLLGIVLAPVIGFLLGSLMMILVAWLARHQTPHRMDRVFRKLQLLSAALYSLGHGGNDAQKTMGIIALALFTGTSNGVFASLPPEFHFLLTPQFKVPVWVVFLCAATMAAGTAAGGWRIIRTLGHKMVKLQPVHGFAAETTAAVIIQAASSYGVPLSTTHVISASIMGVGAAKRFSGVKWGLVERIVWAWILTLPFTALIGFLLARAAEGQAGPLRRLCPGRLPGDQIAAGVDEAPPAREAAGHLPRRPYAVHRGPHERSGPEGEQADADRDDEGRPGAPEGSAQGVPAPGGGRASRCGGARERPGSHDV